MANLRLEEADWDVAVHLAYCLERPGECGAAALARLIDLGNLGAILTAALQIALYRLRDRRADSPSCALDFLRKAIPLWKNGRWKPVNLAPYTGTLVDLVENRDPGPEAEVAADLLDMAAVLSPDAVKIAGLHRAGPGDSRDGSRTCVRAGNAVSELAVAIVSPGPYDALERGVSRIQVAACGGQKRPREDERERGSDLPIGNYGIAADVVLIQGTEADSALLGKRLEGDGPGARRVGRAARGKCKGEKAQER